MPKTKIFLSLKRDDMMRGSKKRRCDKKARALFTRFGSIKALSLSLSLRTLTKYDIIVLLRATLNISESAGILSGKPWKKDEDDPAAKKRASWRTEESKCVMKEQVILRRDGGWMTRRIRAKKKKRQRQAREREIKRGTTRIKRSVAYTWKLNIYDVFIF